MSHSSQTVQITLTYRGRVGEETENIQSPVFVGSPETPLTDDDLKSARATAIGQAKAWLSVEEAKYMTIPSDREGPER